MPTSTARDLSDLEDLRGLSAIDLRQRLHGIGLIALTYVGFMGWRVTLAWLLTAVLVHLVLGPLLARIAEMRASVGARNATGFVVLALSHALNGFLAIAGALTKGPWGVALAIPFISGLIIFAIRVGTESRTAFRAAMIPYGTLLAMLPFVALAIGAPVIVVAIFAIAIAIFLHHFLSTRRSSLKAMAALDAARRRAEAATEAKSAFVAIVSHELRTPISGILAGSAELERSAQDKPTRDNAALIGESARMMRSLLNDLLDLSKIEAGRMSVEQIPFDLRRLVLDATRFWRPETRRSGLRYRLEGARALPQWVVGDPTRVRQILNNLVSNALKFTETGSVTLRFAVLEDAAVLGCRLTLEVIDTGPGMNESQMSRLFGAFDQLGASTARTHGGTGLGLNISRQLAELMNGAIVAQSLEGSGTTFRLTVPLGLAGGPAKSESPADVDHGPQALRVLIVDDHHVNRRAFCLILEPFCSELVAVEDGQQALEALSGTPFDIVLMDLNMPVLGGLEATRRLRSRPGPNRQTAVIALTASVSAKEVDACLAAGMDSFVIKPVEAAELLAAIDQALSAPCQVASQGPAHHDAA
jgi:signal transduction histidine kinase/CheY-like chemotaxis protein